MATWKNYAISYVRQFHAVVPCGAWTFTGKDGKEIDMWKTPLIKNWTVKPLTSEADVRHEWYKWNRWGKTPMIAVATGQICGGYIVIDLDRKPDKGIDGYEYLRSWQRDTGMTLPDTWTAITGSGGYHFWYRTDKAMRGYANYEIGVDLRADGNCVVVPPSLHRNGNAYEWEISPKEFGECAPADDAVIAFINHCRPAGSEYQGGSTMRGTGGERRMVLMPELPEGGRHEPLISAIGVMNRYGFSDEAIETAIRLENELKCIPPLTEDELQTEIFPAIYRWEKGVPAETWKEKSELLQDLKADLSKKQRLQRALASCQS